MKTLGFTTKFIKESQ